MEFDGYALEIRVNIVDAFVIDASFNKNGNASAGLLRSGFGLHGVSVYPEFRCCFDLDS